MSIFASMIEKETLHLLRDFRTMTVVLVMPLVLLLLFGFAISTEVNNVNVVAVVERHTDDTRQVLEKFRVNPYFTFKGIVSFNEVEPMLRAGSTDAAVVLSYDGDRLCHQTIVDATNTNTAQTSAAYIENLLNGSAEMPIITHTLYNPRLKSAYNFVPGIMGMIFILICAMMTSVSIVSEKETGTMDLLLVSPVRPRTIILGKIVPYFLLSCVMLALMLALGYTVLGLPFSASVLNVIWVTILYIVLALSLGLLISTLVSNQVTALLVSGVLLMIPVIMLSGMIFPVENMPALLQWLSCVIPARWYISAMRVLMIQQLPVSYIITEITILASMTMAALILAVMKFKTNR